MHASAHETIDDLVDEGPEYLINNIPNTPDDYLEADPAYPSSNDAVQKPTLYSRDYQHYSGELSPHESMKIDQLMQEFRMRMNLNTDAALELAYNQAFAQGIMERAFSEAILSKFAEDLATKNYLRFSPFEPEYEKYHEINNTVYLKQMDMMRLSKTYEQMKAMNVNKVEPEADLDANLKEAALMNPDYDSILKDRPADGYLGLLDR